jgi:acyl-CoA thioesterase YciA
VNTDPKTQSGSTSEVAIRTVMMPAHTNPQGAIFGGVILSLIDEAAFVEALRQRNHRYVTVAFNGVEFHKPVLVGDVLSLYAQTTRVGRTSLTVRVNVRAFRPEADQTIDVTSAEVVLVAVDHSGQPVPIGDCPAKQRLG